MPETFEQLVARVNSNAYIPPSLPERDRIMAKQIKLSKGKEFTFTSGGGGQSTKYPWDEWFSGTLLLLERSTVAEDGTVIEAKDFDVERDAMPAKIKTAARRRYKVVQISKKDTDGNKLIDALIIKARDMTPDERAAEDLERAEEKAARKEAAEKPTVPMQTAAG